MLKDWIPPVLPDRWTRAETERQIPLFFFKGYFLSEARVGFRPPGHWVSVIFPQGLIDMYMVVFLVGLCLFLGFLEITHAGKKKKKEV